MRKQAGGSHRLGDYGGVELVVRRVVLGNKSGHSCMEEDKTAPAPCFLAKAMRRSSPAPRCTAMATEVIALLSLLHATLGQQGIVF